MDTSCKRSSDYFDTIKYFPLLICCFILMGCSDSDNEDDKIGGGTTTTTTTTTTGGGGTPVDPPIAVSTCEDVAEREIAEKPGLTAHQGNACIDDSDFYITKIIEASKISDSDKGMCCIKHCIEAGAEMITSGVSSDHSCFIVDEEAYLQCYGLDNTSGQLGNGCRSNRRDEYIFLNYVVNEDVTECYDDEIVPEDKRLKGVKQVVLGVDHSCALLEDNKIFCWGQNDQGQLGREGGPSSVPVAVVLPQKKTEIEGEVEIKHITAGDFHNCLLADIGDERIFCWGKNTEGQLGIPFQLTIEEDGTPVWEYDEDEDFIPEPTQIAIVATPNDYDPPNNTSVKCGDINSGKEASCRDIFSESIPFCEDSDNYITYQEKTKDSITYITYTYQKEFPTCEGGGVPVCENGIPKCPQTQTETPLKNKDLVKELNARIEAEKIKPGSSCSQMGPKEEETEVEGEESDKDYTKLGFFGCKLGAHDDDDESEDKIDFIIESGEEKFWENKTEERDYNLPRVPPNFDCEEFYNVDHATTPENGSGGDEDALKFRDHYKTIICGHLSASAAVDIKCEIKILELQAECRSIKSKWASLLERVYVQRNFNQKDEDVIKTYRHVSAGSNHTCAVNFEDQVFCFGDNLKGQLGQAKHGSCEELNLGPNDGFFPKFPLRVKNNSIEESNQNDEGKTKCKENSKDYCMSGVRQIAVGGDFTCAKITQQNNNTGSKIRCWGNPDVRGNKKSEIEKECYPHVRVPQSIRTCNGTDTLVDIESSDDSIDVEGCNKKTCDLADVEFITAGRTHACAVRSCSVQDTNEVVCWGDSSDAQLGRGGTRGDPEYKALPVLLEFGTDKHIPLANIDDSSLNAQKNVTCVSKSGEILCWGQYQSPLGDGINQVILPERLSRQCEARGQSTSSNFLK